MKIETAQNGAKTAQNGAKTAQIVFGHFCIDLGWVATALEMYRQSMRVMTNDKMKTEAIRLMEKILHYLEGPKCF